MTTYQWQTQLSRGQLAQDFICKYYSATPNPQLKDDWDLTMREGCTVELKTDFYPYPQNFFFERYSNTSKASTGPYTGGCFKSKGAAVFYVYYFPHADLIYWFPCGLLADRLERKADRLTVKTVQNPNYVTDGFLVEISRAAPLARVDQLPEVLATDELNQMRETLKSYCLGRSSR